MNRGQSFLLLLMGAVSLLTLFVILPFVEYVIASAILAFILYPFHRRLTRRLRRRVSTRFGEMLSALTLILSAIVAVILPLAYITLVFVRDLTAIAAGETSINVAAIEAEIATLTGQDPEIGDLLQTGGELLVQTLFGGFSGVLNTAIRASVGLSLALFLVYYTLIDGPAFVGWLRETSPLPAEVTADLVDRVNVMTRGVVIGHISVALLQALVAGLGLWAAGIPNVVFWTFVMAVLALLPLIGAFFVWGPAAAYLVIIDQVTAGVFLAVYGVAVIAMVDNYARPLVIDQQAHLNPAVILLGVFGGIYSVGFTGLFVGPIVIGVLAATLETFREDYDAI
ncbi:AI-2E family transporter [Halorubrum ezzemoulense DSM 17463]|uniref:AI-2E family transporter n=1 Tax=Halorubrum ezzemoulense DSM 17463 TaxID=1121945 RepID=A0A1X4H8F8_HALEZ|nr:AI-2E family transporter [Halorubrum ezzemoulense]MDB2241976.1 AI-2E family transporter [Halorubrum ezzemoulense]MDB9232430.1 AI-2E family transporter [Halorubrum ezzemoulense]OSP07968.1 AI-2E family transporter [Halorubrum ezzemoulense DSM 17463]